MILVIMAATLCEGLFTSLNIHQGKGMDQNYKM